jgi:hypothetical protein
MKRVYQEIRLSMLAIVIADILVSCLKNPKEDFLAFIRLISGSPTIDYNLVAQSEKTLVLEMLL